MSVNSMTGYSKITAETDLGKITVEIRSVNRKYCEIQVNIPKMLNFIEDEIRKKVSSSISRGKVDVSIYLDNDAKKNFVNMVPDFVYVQAYIEALGKIKEKFSLAGEIDINVFQGNKDIIVGEQINPDENIIRDSIFSVLFDGLTNLLIEKQREGRKLIDDISQRIKLIEQEVGLIESIAPQTLKKYKDKLMERIGEIKSEVPVDELLIVKEIAVYADRIDISEEIVRLRSHIDNFKATVEKGGSVGKMLDFIIQEMFRESTTIAAKCNNTDISHTTIRIRSELEKIREQVQNIE